MITDKEIRTPLLRNVEFLSHFYRTISPLETAISSILIETLLDLDSSYPRELLTACFSCKIKQAEAAPILWRLIYAGTIKVNLDLPLNMYSALTASGDILELI